MLADPQLLTIGETTVSLPRTAEVGNLAEYNTADGAHRLRVQQSVSKTTRTTSVSLQMNKIAADPLTAVNQRVSALVSVNVKAPLDGFTIDELAAQLVALATTLTASSASMAKKVLGGEK